MKSIVLSIKKWNWGRNLASHLSPIRTLFTILLSALLLSGCVQYDLGVNFEGEHRGEIVQHIKLGEQLTSFSSATAQEWLNSIEQRARQLQGKTQRVSQQEIIVKIPFYTGEELEEKFNQFFNPIQKSAQTADTAANLPDIKSSLSVSQSNLIFFVRNQLIYDLDLRSLGVLSDSDKIIISPGSLFDLEFSLKTPWGARNIDTDAHAVSPAISHHGQQLVWMLQPGQLNHLEVVFWLPSPLGIGALIIILFVAGGIFLKNKVFPGKTTTKHRAEASPSH